MLPISLGPSDGELTIHTSVEGRAARFGHALTITFADWSASIQFDGDRADQVEVSVNVPSLEVTSGTGGATSLTDIDRSLIRRTAAKSLSTDANPTATLVSTSVESDESSALIAGKLSIVGKERPVEIKVKLTDSPTFWSITSHLDLLQSDFGIKPYSAILGSLKVADRVQVRLEAVVTKPAE
jgi:polyisoprenoid-binding protein YceI